MTTFLIGRIMGVKQQERKKTDGTVQVFTLVNVFNQFEDKEGFPITISENVQFPLEEFIKLQSNKGKYIAIPYTSLQTKNGMYVFPNYDLGYFIFEKNPFEMAVKK